MAFTAKTAKETGKRKPNPNVSVTFDAVATLESVLEGGTTKEISPENLLAFIQAATEKGIFGGISGSLGRYTKAGRLTVGESYGFQITKGIAARPQDQNGRKGIKLYVEGIIVEDDNGDELGPISISAKTVLNSTGDNVPIEPEQVSLFMVTGQAIEILIKEIVQATDANGNTPDPIHFASVVGDV